MTESSDVTQAPDEEPVEPAIAVGADGSPVAPPPAEPGREELRDFLGSISGMGAGARRRFNRAVPERMRNRRAVLILCFGLSFAGLIYKARSHRPPAELPIALQGAWATTHNEYADRPFWIGRHQVAFRVGQGPEEIDVYPVTHLDSTVARGDTTVYDIEYAVDGGFNHFKIRHWGLPHPAIVFVHQPQMQWTVVADLNPPVR